MPRRPQTPGSPGVGLLCIVLGWNLLLTPTGQAARPSKSLPPIDRRPSALLTRPSGPPAERRDAEDRLRALIPSVRIDYDPVSGAAKHIRCLDGCLTGPGGAGGSVSKPTLQALPRRLSHRPLRAFLSEHGSLLNARPESLDISAPDREDRSPRSGLSSVVYRQRCEGIDVFEAVLIGHTTERGELLAVSSTWVEGVDALAARWEPSAVARLASPPVRATDAIVTSALSLGIVLDAAQIEAVDITPLGPQRRQQFRSPNLPGVTLCRLVWLPLAREALALCWQVELTRPEGGERYQAIVDARGGQLMLRRCLTVYAASEPATFEVFTSDSPTPLSPGWRTPSELQPPEVARTRVTLKSLSTNASPFGWISAGGNETLGNNVQAHLDLDGDDAPDLPRPQGLPYRVFAPPLDLTRPAEENREAAVIQLFYWCNVMHDWLYELGFTESAGNFQKENFGRGGRGGDPIVADAQDGSGVNNANFTPTEDGEPGRIQMFTFDGADPTRDGDLDAEIVLHEYAHGLSTRLVGGGVGISTLQAGGMGEGWSDFYALALLSEPSDEPDAPYAMGAYVTRGFFGLEQNYYFGIRRYPYSTDMAINPLRFRDIDGSQISSYPAVPRNPVFPFSTGFASEVHNQGEVWCVTLWDARASLIRKHGWEKGNPLILQLVTDGMKLSPPNPNFLQARDAILQTDLVSNGGANLPELWAAFARRGMGFNAQSPVSSFTSGIREAFDLPDALALDRRQGFVYVSPVGGPVLNACQSLQITNTQGAPVSWTIGNPASWLVATPSTGMLSPYSSVSIDLCLNEGTLQLERGRYQTNLTVTNLTSGVVQSRPIDVRLLQFGQLPFLDDFEESSLRPEWFVSTPPWGRVQVTGLGDPHGGSRHMLLDSDSEGLFARNEVTLGLDTRGWTNLVLRFWAKEFADESHTAPKSPFVDGADFDGVSVSADGTRWYEVQALSQLSSKAREFVIPLNTVIRTNALHYGAHFQVRISQYDNFPIPVDGIAIDELSLEGDPVGRFRLELPKQVVENERNPATGALVLATASPQDNVFTLTASDPGELTVTKTVVIRAGDLRGTFELIAPDNSFLDGTREVTVSAQAEGYYGDPSILRVTDDETAHLTLRLPSEVAEGVGILKGAGFVELDQKATRPIQVQLLSKAPKRIAVPKSIVIPVGSLGASFDLSVPDGRELEGTTRIQIIAEVEGLDPGLGLISHWDNEAPTLELRLPQSLSEDTPSTRASLVLGGVVETNVVAQLTPGSADLISSPLSVVIPAGATQVSFSISAANTPVAEGKRRVTLNADASGFTPGFGIVEILDDETPPLVYGPSPRSGATNQTPKLELRWKPGFGDILINGDFELGSLAGWVTFGESGRGWVIDDGNVNPDGPGLPTPPFEGSYGAVLAQQSPGRHGLFQDVSIPADAKSATLSWRHLIQNQGPEYFSPLQQYRVEVLDLSGEVIETAFTTQAGDPLRIEWTEQSYNLTRYRGQTLRIQFLEDDALGFINVWLDAVRLELGTTGTTEFEVYLTQGTEPTPADLIGVAKTNRFQLTGLSPLASYHWQIVSVRDGVRTPGPVWQFQIRGVGQVDTLEWSSLPEAIQSGTLFSAELTAKDEFGLVATNFNGLVSLSGQGGSPSANTVLISEIDPGAADAVELCNVSSGAVDLSGWQLFVYDSSRWPAAKTNFVLPSGTVLSPGSVCTFSERGRQPGPFPFFQLGTSIAWGTLAVGQPTGVVLVDASSNLVDVACAVDADPSQFISPYRMPPDAWIGYPLPALLSTTHTWQRVGVRDRNVGGDWTVAERSIGRRNPDLTLPFEAVESVVLGPSSSIAMTAGRWSGSLFLEGNLPQVTLRAEDGSNHAGVSRTLTLRAPNDVALLRLSRPAFSLTDSSFNFTYLISNSGPATVSGATFTSSFPDTLQLEEAAIEGLLWVRQPGCVRFPLPDLASGASMEARLRFISPSPGSFTNEVELELELPDSFSGNNQIQDVIELKLPVLTVLDISRPEGDTGTNLFTFNVRLSGPIQREVRVRYKTVDEGATSGEDYVGVAGELLFPPGSTNQPVSVAVIGDRVYEPNEQFLLRLSDPVNALILDDEGKATLREEESAPDVEVAGRSISEGGAGTRRQLLVPVWLSGPTSVPVSISYATANLTALSLSDYVGIHGQLVFNPGVTQLNLSIPILDDNRFEGNESFLLLLTNAVNAKIRTTKATIQIEDDDAAELTSLLWSRPAATQTVHQPFPVTLSARDGLGGLFAAFQEPLSLRAFSARREAAPPGESNLWGFPLRSFFHDARGQFLYPASELGAAGRITTIALPVESLPGQPLTQFTLRVKATLEETLSQQEWDNEGWTTLMSRDLEIYEPGLVTIPVVPPIDYDARRGLLVDISFDNQFFTVDGLCTAVDTEGLRGRVFESDGAFASPLTWSGVWPPAALTNKVPRLQFGIEEPVEIKPRDAQFFLDGIWEGQITVDQEVDQLRLAGRSASGLEAWSLPIVVRADPALSARPQILSLELNSLGLVIRFQGLADHRYQLESSERASQPVWEPVGPVVTGDPGGVSVNDTRGIHHPQRFYRVREFP